MPELRLDAVDAAELAELLQFLAGWLARDPDRLGVSLEAFVGHPAYGIAQLRQDLNRFTFLLGGDDGESLFGPDAPGWGDDHDQPAARAQEPRRRRLRRRSSSGTPRRVRGRPSGPKTATHRLRRRPAAGLTPETTTAPGARKSGQARPAPALRAARKPGGCGPQRQAERQDTAELAFDSQGTGKITNLGRCQGSSEADPSRIK